jgi:hypothetical protein
MYLQQQLLLLLPVLWRRRLLPHALGWLGRRQQWQQCAALGLLLLQRV